MLLSRVSPNRMNASKNPNTLNSISNVDGPAGRTTGALVHEKVLPMMALEQSSKSDRAAVNLYCVVPGTIGLLTVCVKQNGASLKKFTISDPVVRFFSVIWKLFV